MNESTPADDNFWQLGRRQLDLLIQQTRVLSELFDQSEKTEMRLTRLEELQGCSQSNWTLAAWMNWHGHRVSVDVLKHEGKELWRICRARGIVIPKQKVCNGGSWPATNWPIEAIRIWWPGCCARYGWPVEWKI